MTEYTARPAAVSRLVSLRNLRSAITPPARISHRWRLLGEFQSLQKHKTCDRNDMSVMQRGVSSLEIIAFRLDDPAVLREDNDHSRNSRIGTCDASDAGTAEADGVHEFSGISDTDHRSGYETRYGLHEATERSAIVVAEAHGTAMGLLVESVSDILAVSIDMLLAVPEVGSLVDTSFSDGIIVHPSGMICFLKLTKIFDDAIPQPRYGT